MAQPAPDGNGWLDNAHLKSRYGDLNFRNGYPTKETADRVRDAMTVNRAVEVYLAQMPTVSWYAVWKGVRDAADKRPNQMVIWEHLMDAQTLLLTGNTETVYGLAAIDLRQGPVVVEVPAKMLGGFSDIRQTELLGIGPTGADKGQGGKVLLLPPGFQGNVPDGYIVGRSATNRVVFGVRGFQVDGKTDEAVALMKKTRIYPLSGAANSGEQAFVDGSGKQIDTLFPDTGSYFTDLGRIAADEPADKRSASSISTLTVFSMWNGSTSSSSRAWRTFWGRRARARYRRQPWWSRQPIASLRKVAPGSQTNVCAPDSMRRRSENWRAHEYGSFDEFQEVEANGGGLATTRSSFHMPTRRCLLQGDFDVCCTAGVRPLRSSEVGKSGRSFLARATGQGQRSFNVQISSRMALPSTEETEA
jgi:hypothetical protein